MNSFEPVRRLVRTALIACVRFSARHAIAVLVAATFVSALLLWYAAAHVAINTDTAGMLDPDLPFQKAGREFDAAFPVLNDQIVAVVESAHGGPAVSAADDLARRLRRYPSVLESVFQPGGGDFFATNGLLYLDEDKLWSLDERLAEAAPLLGILAQDSSLRGLFDAMRAGLDEGDAGSYRLLARMFDRISGAMEAELAGRGAPVSWRDELFLDSGTETAVVREFVLLKPKLDFGTMEPARDALQLVHRVGGEIERQIPGVRVRVTGTAAMNSEELVTVSRDAVWTMLLAFALVCALLVWGLRSAGTVLAVQVALLFGLIWTAAFAFRAVGTLNLISVTFAVLFIGMGVDFGIQFALRYQEEIRRGLAGETALSASAEGVGGALTLAAAGAAVGFLSFLPTSYRGLAELGVIAAFSMIVALVTSLLVLPAFLILLPAPRSPSVTGDASCAGISRVILQGRRAIALLSVLTGVASAALAPSARFDFNPLNLKDQSTDSVAAFRDLAADPDTSPYIIQILAPDLDRAQALAARLEALDVVDKALTLASYVPSGQETKLEIIDGMRIAMVGVLPATQSAAPASVADEIAAIIGFQQRLAEARAATREPAVADSMARLERALVTLQSSAGWEERIVPALRKNLLGDLVETLDRLERALGAGPVTLEQLPGDLRARYLAADGRARVEVFPTEDLNDNAALAKFVRAVQALAPDATDSPVELLEAGDAVIGSCIQATAIALGLGFLMNVVVLRSAAGAVLAALPLLLAMLFTIATSVIVDAPLNFANIIALPLMIGLSNAYGVYLVLRRQSTESLAQLLGTNTPRAVLLSGMTTIASFGTLGLATHPGMAGMGFLITLSLGYALLSSLVILPAIMATIER